MEYFFLFILLSICLALLARPITVFLHEMGHAIPSLLMTGKKVTIYVGSYGDPEKSVKLSFGKIEMYFRYNPFAWRLGLCVPSAGNISVNRQIFITIAGPFASLITGSLSIWLVLAYDLHGFLKLFLVIFLGSAILDLISNLVPNARPIRLYDGTITYNDGYQLSRLLYYKRLPKAYFNAEKLLEEKRISEAAAIMDKLLAKKPKHEHMLRMIAYTFFQNNEFEKVKTVSQKLIALEKMNADDWGILAVAHGRLGEYDQSFEFFDTAMKLDANHKYNLNNKGFMLTLVDRYEEAIPLFDKALSLDNDFAYAYDNRGLCRIRLGQEEEGLNDINHSLKLDKDNAYGYRNLGIYHFHKGEYEEALQLLKKAKELDRFTHNIDDLIKAAEAKL